MIKNKIRLGYRDMLNHFIGSSACRVTPNILDRTLEIIFTGACARIPSLKNSKIPGMNFHNPEVTAKLVAMTKLYQAACIKINQPKMFGYANEQLFVLIQLQNRTQRFDEDNCLAAVKDWLEPYGLKKRKWGIGITDNDTFVNAYAHKWSHIEEDRPYTRILIRPMIPMAERLKEVLNTIG